jgi:hypothetical protein
MIKKIIKLFTFSWIFIFLLVACEGEKTEVPVHESDSIWHIDDTYHWHGCLTENCSSVFDKVEHSWSGWTVSKEPTCTTFGEEYRTCSVCNYEQKKSVSKTPFFVIQSRILFFQHLL